MIQIIDYMAEDAPEANWLCIINLRLKALSAWAAWPDAPLRGGDKLRKPQSRILIRVPDTGNPRFRPRPQAR